MKIFKNKKSLIKHISRIKNLAFVPTMGTLHKGHISLIKEAKKKSKNILVSIFVNPKQFNSKKDYKKYPRNINKDIKILKKENIKFLYLPDNKDIYSFKPITPIYLHKFSKELCGKFRPGHFKGVINVVNRFLEIVKPKYLFLGEKDLQQLILIQMHIIKNKIKTLVVPCKTLRSNTGVALSSRNLRLNRKDLKIASQISYFLHNNKKELIKKLIKNQKKEIIKKIYLLGAKKIDYIEAVSFKKFKIAKRIKNKLNIFIAYYLNDVRLIDNL